MNLIVSQLTNKIVVREDFSHDKGFHSDFYKQIKGHPVTMCLSIIEK